MAASDSINGAVAGPDRTVTAPRDGRSTQGTYARCTHAVALACVVARARSPAKRVDAFLLSRRGGAKIPAPRDPSDARSSPDPRRFTHDLIHDILPGSPLRRRKHPADASDAAPDALGACLDIVAARSFSTR